MIHTFHSTFQAYRNKQNPDNESLTLRPSIDSVDNGVVVEEDGENKDIGDIELHEKTGLKINKACFKPGQNNQS
jgi:hypothetical protein